MLQAETVPPDLRPDSDSGAPAPRGAPGPSAAPTDDGRPAMASAGDPAVPPSAERSRERSGKLVVPLIAVTLVMAVAVLLSQWMARMAFSHGHGWVMHLVPTVVAVLIGAGATYVSLRTVGALERKERREAEMRQLAEEALRRTKRKGLELEATVEFSDDAIFTRSLDGTILTWNSGAERLHGYSSDEAVGMQVEALVPPDRVSELAHLREACGRGERVEAFETTRVRKDGSLVDVSVATSPIKNPGSEITGLLTIARDISERKRAENEVRESFERLRKTESLRRKLFSRLVTAQEDERRMIAADIHDEAIQEMSALGMRLQLLRRTLNEPGQVGAVERIERVVGKVIADLRHLLFELHPRTLDDQGLAAALREYLEARSDAFGHCEIENRLTADLEPETQITAYRIALEALANVRKHAKAQRVEVLLEERDKGLFLEIRDDGVGIEESELSRSLPGHLGLASIRRRAEMAGGWSRITSLPGAGTTVWVWLPM